MSQKRDYYEVLGCSRDSSPEDLRKAYKREALKHHPDRNQGNPNAELLFREASEAYQVLSDHEKKGIYDQFGHAGLEGGQSGFDGGVGDVFAHMQDLFSEMFSGGIGGGFGPQRGAPRRGGDLRVQQRLTLKDAAFGCKREVVVHAPTRCGDCSGSGARAGTKPETCPQCRGAGHVSNARGFVMFTTPCPRCQGQGAVIKQACQSCAGHGVVQRARKVSVSFPAGIDAGQRLRVQGQGMPGPGGSEAGDLYVEIDVEEDARFERDGSDLVARAHVSFSQAALGSEIEVPSLEDENATVTISIPGGTQPGSVLSVKGRGIPRLDGRGRGSLAVVVQVDVPNVLTERARALLDELDAELRGSTDAKDGASGRRAAAGK